MASTLRKAGSLLQNFSREAKHTVGGRLSKRAYSKGQKRASQLSKQDHDERVSAQRGTSRFTDEEGGSISAEQLLLPSDGHLFQQIQVMEGLSLGLIGNASGQSPMRNS